MFKVGAIFMVTAVAALGFPVASSADDEAPAYGWKKEMVANLNVTQASFDNWAAGGENTLAWQLNVNGKFTHVAERREWANSAKVAYGQAKIGDAGSRKSVDEISLETILTYKAGIYVDPYVAASAETQVLKGYKYTESDETQVSAFLDPGYFTQSAGVGRSQGDVFKTRLGVSLKETITDKFPQPYADDPETEDVEKTRVEVGAESVTDLSLKLRQNLLFTSRVEIFSNLEAFDEIDVKWDNVLAAKVDKYVEVNLNVKLVYDSDVSKKRQIKQALALGLTYSFL
jgi:hypothetical protein